MDPLAIFCVALFILGLAGLAWLRLSRRADEIAEEAFGDWPDAPGFTDRFHDERNNR
jgi:hypothetical protein